MCDYIWENQPVSVETISFFLLLCSLLCCMKMPLSKFEANSSLNLRIKRASFLYFQYVFVLVQLFLHVHDN